MQKENTDPLLLELLNTIVRVSQLLYSFDDNRTPKTVLRLYNVTWYHHELCCHFLSTPKHQSRSHLFGIYLHDLVVHAPPIYQQVCLRSLNAESQERLFSQAKHISLRATNYKPENVLPKILISMQARQMSSDCQASIHRQDSMVSTASSKLGPYRGTFITEDFISSRLSSWQAHLTRISAYMKHGEGVWWHQKEGGFKFNDGVDDPDFQTPSPHLDHFRSTTLPNVYCTMSHNWDSILQNVVKLPSPSIRVYDADGNYQHTITHVNISSFNETTASETDQNTRLTTPPNPQQGQSSLSPTSTLQTTPQQGQSSLSPLSTLQTTPQQGQSSLSPLSTLQTTPQQGQSSLFPLSTLQTTPQQGQSSLFPLSTLQTTPQQGQSSLSPLSTLQTTPQQGQSSLSPLSTLQTTPKQGHCSQSPLSTLQTTPKQGQSSLSPLSTLQTTPQQGQSSLSPLSTLQTTPKQGHRSLSPLSTLHTIPQQGHRSQSPLSTLHTIPKQGQRNYSPEAPQQSTDQLMDCTQLQNRVLPTEVFDCIPSAELNYAVENLQIMCNVEDSVDTGIGEVELQSKAANVFFRIIGHSADLKRFDELRVKLRQAKQSRPTRSEKEEYKTLLAKIQCKILSIKYTTKETLKSMEKDWIATKGSDIQHLQSNPKYKEMYNQVGHTKKVLSIWKSFDI